MAKERLSNQGVRTPTISQLCRSSREGTKQGHQAETFKDTPLGLDKYFGNALPEQVSSDPYRKNSNSKDKGDRVSMGKGSKE